MVVYFARKYDSAQAGTRVVGIECEKCDCKYFYELARIGSGSASAPYGIATSAAARSATEQSQRDLQERLLFEAELVPCPNCNWISEELVQGYRQGRYRRIGMMAACVTILGTAGSLIAAWIIWRGPAVDRGELPYVLLGGPAIFALLSIAMILLRNWLRSRIRPNWAFPREPQVPLGTPPALLLNESTGRLEVARPREHQAADHRRWYELQIGRHQLPPVCCECLKENTDGHAYKRPVDQAIQIVVPWCRECARRARWAFLPFWLLTFVVSVLVGGGALLALQLDPVLFWIFFVAYLLVCLGLAAYVASAKTAPVQVARGDMSRGIVRLRFRNPKYGQLLESQR